MNVQVYSMAYPVTSLGPGRRVVLWVAGCTKTCDGCISPEMRDPSAGKAVPISTLRRRILELDPHIEGITISGGEPFDQARSLAQLLETIREDRPDWNVLVYSGYTLYEISQAAERCLLLPFVDVVIDGPFKRDIPATHPLAGSGNQVIHYLSARASTLKCAMDACSTQQLNLGIGNGSFDMLIGVVNDSLRERVCDTLSDLPEQAGGPGAH